MLIETTDQEALILQEILAEKLATKNLSKFYQKIILNILQKLENDKNI